MNKFAEELRKEFGGNLTVASDKHEEYKNITWLDTGNYTLNKAINKKGLGLPTGNMVEFFGASASGKSVIGLHCLKSTIDKGGVAVLIDAEGSLDTTLASDIGIDLDQLLIIDPTVRDSDDESPLTTEEVFQRTETIIKRVREQFGPDQLLSIVWDSLASTNFPSDLEENGPKETQGRPEKHIKHWIRRIRPLVNSGNVLWLIINQVYSVISSVPTARNTRTPGGRAVGFHSNTRVEFILKEGKAGKVFDKNGLPIGARLHFKIFKNRVGPPWREGFIEFYFNEDGEPSIDYYSGYLNYLADRDAIKVGKGRVLVGDDSYRSRKISGKYYQSEFVDKMMEEHPELLKV
jgi:recombination protein RecA